MADKPEILIVGGGIGGLTLALFLHKRGLSCTVYESAGEIRPLGVGLNLLPHAMERLHALGLEDELLRKGIETQEYRYYSRHGQLVDHEPRGRFQGHARPQLSIPRGLLHLTLLHAVLERLGPDAVRLGHRCVDIEQDDTKVMVHFVDPAGEPIPSVTGDVMIACDGIHSVARRKYHPEGAEMRFEGTMQYRGTTRWQPFLTGASLIYLGVVETGKLVMYPMEDHIDDEGRQLINWVVELVRPAEDLKQDWNRKSDVNLFLDNFAAADFPWLDVRAVLAAADQVFEYPMVDRDPLSSWTTGRVTLLGDAAHPMMPRGSNGATQAIIDAQVLSEKLAGTDPVGALKAYEEERLAATGKIVVANRSQSPDAILELVEQRTGGARFANIDDVISPAERTEWQSRYRQIAGFGIAVPS